MFPHHQSTTSIFGCCFRMMVSYRKKLLNTGAICMCLGAAFTFIMFYSVNRVDLSITKTFSRLHDVDRAEILTHFIDTEDSRRSNGQRVNRIQDLVNNVELVNITKPWFTIFPVDDYIQSFMSYFTKRNTSITSLPTSYSLNARIDCQKSKTTLLLLVPSVVGDEDIRRDIRNTWASHIYDSNMAQNDIAKIAFFFGDAALNDSQKEILREESDKFGDIVTINLMDSYRNLSLKISSMLLWSSYKCPSAEFVAKVDVDTWINIPLMVKLLNNLTDFNQRNNISASTLGFRHAYNKPAAVHSGKWEIPMDIYPYNFLPRYVYGHSYVLSRRAVDNVVSTFPYFPTIPNEDAFVTGIMSLVSNVTRVHSAAFGHLFKDQTFKDIQENRYVSSIYSKNNLLEIWNQLTHGNATSETI